LKSLKETFINQNKVRFFKKKMFLVLGKKFGEMFVRELWQHALLEKITNLD
jgi:hypothetical protein